MSEKAYVSVREYFKGKNLFITGGTGFVGKVLLEKILRSVPEIGTIYVLVRPKNNESIKQRFSEIFSSLLFDQVKRENPSALEKIHLIEGDLTNNDLGISADDVDELRRNVSIVIHSAASVRFDESIHDSVQMNLLGTKRLLRLCSTMPHLQNLQHVSTCYANCDNEIIEECVYDQSNDPEEIIRLVETMESTELEALREKLLGGKPNTYTFTKSLSEILIRRFQQSVKFPVSIVRPSIIVASLSEPMPGWVDNFNGPSGIVCAAACGFLRSVYSKRELRADFIPVDIVANTIIASTWKAGISNAHELYVYNCASGNRAPPLTWADFESFQVSLLEKITFNHAVRYPQLTLRRNWFLHRVSMVFQHMVPAVCGDTILNLLGKKPYLSKVYNRLLAMQEALSFFTTHEWLMRTENVEALSQLMSEEDRENFNTEMSGLNWTDFLENYVRGLRDFVLKENHKEESNWFQRLYLIEQFQNAVLLLIAYKTFGVGEMISSTLEGYF